MTNTSSEWVQRYSSNLSTTEQNKLVSISVKYSISIIIWSVFSITLNIFPFWDGSQHCSPQKALFNCLRFYFHNTCIYKKCERYKEHSSKVKILLCTVRKTWWTAKQKSKNRISSNIRLEGTLIVSMTYLTNVHHYMQIFSSIWAKIINERQEETGTSIKKQTDRQRKVCQWQLSQI